jgi:hypothetical protein
MINPNKTGNAVRSSTPLRSTGLLSAQIRRNVHPIINEAPSPMAYLYSEPGLKSEMPYSDPPNVGNNIMIADIASATAPIQ